MTLRVVVATAGLLAAGCGGQPVTTVERAPARGALLVSGRDDHGMLAEASPTLRDEPGGGPTVTVADGTVVAVVATRHEWLLVATTEDPRVEGWINDYYLRGTAHLACTGEQVELLAARRGRALVRALDGDRARWVDTDTVAELPGAPCGA